MHRSRNVKIYDALYGEINFGSELSSLIWSPQIQRLRHIRLSNIDSFEMPGIANISRYEHSLGTCYLSSRVPLMKTMPMHDALAFQAAALCHDWDTTPFGHLIGEALMYVSADYEHERQLSKIVEDKGGNELGGLNRQMIHGRGMNIQKWTTNYFGNKCEDAVSDIGQYVRGEGKYGKLISSAVDLDNLDNLTRIAYHMGLPVDRFLPIRVAENMLDSSSETGIVFGKEVIPYLEDWLNLRDKVYSHLMLSRIDFAAKAMLIQATIWAYQRRIINRDDWVLTDMDFVTKLLRCDDKIISETIKKWISGEIWRMSELHWFKLPAPAFKSLLEFNNIISSKLTRECFSYRIIDKRNRKVDVQLNSGEKVTIGSEPQMWLLGVVSSKAKDFTQQENNLVVAEACRFFGTSTTDEKEYMPLFRHS